MSEEKSLSHQNVFIYDRKKLSITGVSAVDSFDETNLCATMCDGEAIVVEGSGISVTDVNLENGSVEAEGNFTGVFYMTQQKSTSGLFSRLFKSR